MKKPEVIQKLRAFSFSKRRFIEIKQRIIKLQYRWTKSLKPFD